MSLRLGSVVVPESGGLRLGNVLYASLTNYAPTTWGGSAASWDGSQIYWLQTNSGVIVSGQIPDVSILLGNSVSFSIANYFAGYSGTNGFSLETGSLPTGLLLNASSGLITGTPTGAGTSSGLSITATDGTDSVTSNTFSIYVVSDDSRSVLSIRRKR